MSGNKIDILAKMIKYHEDVYKIYNSYLFACSLLKEKEHERFWTDFYLFCSVSLKNHFLFEELVVFKGVLGVHLSVKTKAVTVRLIREHSSILLLTESIFLKRKDSIENRDFIQKELTQLFRQLIVHSHVEETIVLPLLETRGDVQVLSGREFLKHRDKFIGDSFITNLYYKPFTA